MFYHVRGELIYRDDTTAVVECGGVGYKATVSHITSDSLSGKMNKEVRLFTHLAVREDGIELFGFASTEELDAFKLLTSVSGVGPKAAMSVLSLFDPDRLAMVIGAEDVKAIAKAPNIGPKTAARIVLELKDKMTGFAPSAQSGKGTSGTVTPMPGNNGKLSEAADALTVLGYGRTEIVDVLRKIDTQNMALEQIITAALRLLTK